MSKQIEDKVTRRLFEQIAIILVSPRVSENIGAAARAMKNFALADLRLVAPRDLDMSKARKMARDGADVLEKARTFTTLEEALADLTFVAATTARTGDNRSAQTATPSACAKELLKACQAGPVGLVFGPEERGLTNRELDHSQLHVTIPTNPDFSSLNLAQAVVVCCYEISQAGATDWFTGPPPSKEGALATAGEVEGLFSHAREFLLAAGYLNPQNPDAVLLHLRRLLGRAKPTSHEIRTLRGIVRQVSWYAEQKKKQD